MVQLDFFRSFRTFSILFVLIGGVVFSATLPIYAQSLDRIDRLIEELDEPSASKRFDAIRQLSQFGHQASKATDRLIARLDDTNNDVRVEAAYAVSCVRTDDARVLAALVLLLVDADEHVRYSAEWSIARIVKELPDDLTAEAIARLTPILEEALRALKSNDHQPRNRMAIELALSRLTQAPTLEPQPITHSEQPSAPAFDSNLLAQSVYEASDRLGRFLFVNRLSDSDKYPDSLRQIVLTFESNDLDGVILDYAVRHWGEVGQKNLATLIDQIDATPTEAHAQLIQHLSPDSIPRLERLFAWATDRDQEQMVRMASIAAIAKAKLATDRRVKTLIEIVSDEKSDEEVRAAATDSLGRLGSEAAQAESCLLAALRQNEHESMRFAALDAIEAIAPQSATVAETLISMLNNEPTDTFIYPSLIESCGHLGDLGRDTARRLTELLKHDDADIRGAAAQALGRIGLPEPSAIGLLIECIVDNEELVSVKNRASIAIGKLGAPAIESLIEALRTSELEAQESVLRALAIVGPSAVIARLACLEILSDEQNPVSLRAAAANAAGAMGPSELLIAEQVLDRSTEKEAEMVRAACLIAASQMHPVSSKSTILQQTLDPSLLVRASAAYALHVCGESRMGFDSLLNMLNGSETDDIIRQTLTDFGNVVENWSVEIANDTRATREARLACFSIACDAESPAWNELLPLVEDFELGEEFAMSLESYWHPFVADEHQENASSIAMLLSMLESQPFTTVARARIAGLLSPDGLGAAGDEEDWQGITLSKPFATSALLANDEAVAAFEPSRSASSEAWPEAPSASPTPDASTSPVAAQPATETELPGATNEIRPKKAIRAQAADRRDLEPTFSKKVPKEVDVFYGTNRSRIAKSTTLQSSATPFVATIVGSFGIMLFSLVGLWRSGSRVFATIALLAIGFIAPMSFIAIQSIAQHFSNTAVAYGGDYCDSIEYGMCQVSIPPIHQSGELEAPSLLRLEVKSDPNKHVVLTQVEQLSHDAFFADLQSMQAKNGKNLLVFIHGYNVSFEDAARRTAQMSNDLAFPGAPVFFSWPSQANWYGYRADHENIHLSITQIKEFLLDLVERSGAETINLVAHSMGNVGLTEALKEIQAMDEKPLFNQVVLAAPDIDANIFKSRIAPHIVGKAKNLTLYTSQSDLALIASRFFNHGQRIGDSGPEALNFPGIDTIDATAVDSSLLGHTYYGDNVSVLTDLGQLLRNQPITNRHYLKQVNHGMTFYWAFDPLRISKTFDASVR